MRLVYAIAVLLCSALAAFGAEPAFVVTNKVPAFTVVNKVETGGRATICKWDATQNKYVTSSTCDCAATGKCLCWAGECRCDACGLGGAAVQVGKLQRPVSSGMNLTDAQRAGISHRLAAEPGSSAGTPEAGTSINARSALQSGSTSSGCANGNCPSSRPSSRGFRLLFR